jgi:hypothetical protein
MANGDDGYTNGGGGGSVWWELQVSEAERINHEPPPKVTGDKHRKRRDGHGPFRLSGWDKFTHILADRPGTIDGDPADGHDQFEDQGDGYFVITIDDASTIRRVEVEGNRLRLYVPVNAPLPLDPQGNPQRNQRQVRLAWGLRSAVDRNKQAAFGWGGWNALRAWLLGAEGKAVDASLPRASIEVHRDELATTV